MDKRKCIVPSWKDMHEMAEGAAEQIKKSAFHPDIIIGLSRGGLVPARLFADLLHVKEVYTINVDHWGLTATMDGSAKLTQKLNVDISGKKVLVVDDITDTGQSIDLAKKHVEELKPGEVKTAALMNLKTSKFVPDYYGIEREWAWYIFPWNYKEDLVNLIKEVVKEEKKNREEIKKELHVNFELEVGEEEVDSILEHIEYLDGVKG